MRSSLIDGARQAIAVGIACAIVGVIIGVLTLTGAASNFAGFVLDDRLEEPVPVAVPDDGRSAWCSAWASRRFPTTSSPARSRHPRCSSSSVPLIVSHMFVFYFGIMADLTPPVALAAFAAASIAKASPMKIGWKATHIAIAGFVIPYMAVYDPSLMLQTRDLARYRVRRVQGDHRDPSLGRGRRSATCGRRSTGPSAYSRRSPHSCWSSRFRGPTRSASRCAPRSSPGICFVRARCRKRRERGLPDRRRRRSRHAARRPSSRSPGSIRSRRRAGRRRYRIDGDRLLLTGCAHSGPRRRHGAARGRRPARRLVDMDTAAAFHRGVAADAIDLHLRLDAVLEKPLPHAWRAGRRPQRKAASSTWSPANRRAAPTDE